MDRQTFYLGLLVTPGELQAQQDNIELADAHVLDTFSLGNFPIAGLAPTVSGADLVVSVSAGRGIAAGSGVLAGASRLVRLRAGAQIDLAGQLPLGAPRWVLVGLRFLRIDSDPRVDREGVTVYFTNDEGSELVAVPGAEGGGKPDVPVDVVPIVDFLLGVGQAALHPADIDRRRARPANGKQGSPGGIKAQLDDILATRADNCRVVASDLADMQVHVRPGRVNFAGKSFDIPATDVALFATPTVGDHNVGLVHIDDAGAVQVTWGDQVPLADPAVAPSHVGKLPLAEITVAHTTTEVLYTDIVDVRPNIDASCAVPRHFLLDPAVGGEAAIVFPFRYTVGENALMVFRDGKLLDGGGADYDETDDHTITLVVPMVAGHALEGFGLTDGADGPTSHARSHSTDEDPIDFGPMNGWIMPGLELYGDSAGFHLKPFSGIVAGRQRMSDADIFVAVPGGLAVNTWHYLYAAWVGGAMVVEIDVEGPDAQRRMKSTDATRAYLAAFRTTSTPGEVRAFIRRNRKTTYQINYNSGTPGAANYGNADHHTGDTLLTTLDLSAALPPHCLAAEIDFTVIGGGGANTSIQPSARWPDVPPPSIGINATGAAVGVNPKLVWMPVGTDQSVQVANDANGTRVDAFPLSYED